MKIRHKLTRQFSELTLTNGDTNEVEQKDGMMNTNNLGNKRIKFWIILNHETIS